MTAPVLPAVTAETVEAHMRSEHRWVSVVQPTTGGGFMWWHHEDHNDALGGRPADAFGHTHEAE